MTSPRHLSLRALCVLAAAAPALIGGTAFATSVAQANTCAAQKIFTDELQWRGMTSDRAKLNNFSIQAGVAREKAFWHAGAQLFPGDGFEFFPNEYSNRKAKNTGLSQFLTSVQEQIESQTNPRLAAERKVAKRLQAIATAAKQASADFEQEILRLTIAEETMHTPEAIADATRKTVELVSWRQDEVNTWAAERQEIADRLSDEAGSTFAVRPHAQTEFLLADSSKNIHSLLAKTLHVLASTANDLAAHCSSRPSVASVALADFADKVPQPLHR
jgi:hypothetical protein